MLHSPMRAAGDGSMARQHYKTCYYCGKVVHPGSGEYYYGHLVHGWCVNLKKARRVLREGFY